MAAEDTLRVDPAAMRWAADAVNGGAEDLRNRLGVLQREVGALLEGWRGASGKAFAAAWEEWRRGAGEVQAGLSILAHGLAEADRGYQRNELESAREMRGVVGRG
jgi:WXG100 family type VII secretion target